MWCGLARILALTVLPMLAASAAFAQQPAASAEAGDTVKLEKFVVTGSFIRKPRPSRSRR